jgi:hypothetical protein
MAVQQYSMPQMFTDDRLRCARDKHSSRVDVHQFAGKQPPCHTLMYVCKQARDRHTSHTVTYRQYHAYSPARYLWLRSAYSSIPSPPSLPLQISSPSSTNAGTEFVSKIDLAIQYETVQSNNGKVPDMHYVVLKCTLMYCCDFLECWSTGTSISQSLAEQTQALSNKHHSLPITCIYTVLFQFS